MSGLRVSCLASGSSGNSLLLQWEGKAILIDAGISARKLTTYLLERNVSPENLLGIFVTHEHSDHISGIELLAKRFDTPVLCTEETRKVLSWLIDGVEYEVYKKEQSIEIEGLEIQAFSLPHDAADPVGYQIRYGGYAVSVITDLGAPTVDAVSAARTSDLVVIEANHDVDRLISGPYPWHLKKRIMSDRGHLSNLQAAQLISSALRPRPQQFWLAHLSKRNNTKTCARDTVLSYLNKLGISIDLYVTERDKPSLVWEPPLEPAVQLSLFGSPKQSEESMEPIIF